MENRNNSDKDVIFTNVGPVINYCDFLVDKKPTEVTESTIQFDQKESMLERQIVSPPTGTNLPYPSFSSISYLWKRPVNWF